MVKKQNIYFSVSTLVTDLPCAVVILSLQQKQQHGQGGRTLAGGLRGELLSSLL